MKTILLIVLLTYGLLAQTAAYLVLQKGASSLAYYTPDGKLIATVPVGQHPHEMKLSPDGKFLYTTDNGTMKIEEPGKGGNSVSIIEVQTRRKIGDIPLGDFHRPHGIDVDPKTGRLLITTELPDRLLLVDPVKRGIIKTYGTKGKTSHMVTLGPGGKWAYVSNSSSGNVSAVNLENGDVKLIETGARPEGSVLSKDGRELYVANREGAAITVIDTAKQQAIAAIKTGKGPVRVAITPDGKTLAYALMHDKKVAFADPATRRETGHVILPGLPVSCSISSDGKFALASTEETDTVYIISIAGRKIAGEIKTAKGAGPDPVLRLSR
jgi:YVTN family beta-propeller protein